MSKARLDLELVARGLVPTRSQAESYIKLGQVQVNKQVVTKPGSIVAPTDAVRLMATEQYVSRAGLKLASVSKALRLDFKGKVVLDVGSSTGGFTDYALQHGARKSIAVDVGTNQLHPTLRTNPNIELHEQTDIRDVFVAADQRVTSGGAAPENVFSDKKKILGADRLAGPAVIISETPDIVVIDVSFISLREILPTVAQLSSPHTQIVAMVKPQFEAGSGAKHGGVIKNDRMRRDILKDFEQWTRELFVIQDKADSEVSGAKGNLERFYLLKKIQH